MKKNSILLLIILLHTFFATSQQPVSALKKKYFGTYEGIIKGYSISSDTSQFHVDSTSMTIQINASTIALTIGKISKNGTYQPIFKGKKYYVIDATFPGSTLAERLIIHEQKKYILREGTPPQPNAYLYKIKK